MQTFFRLVIVAPVLIVTGCATINDHCKGAASPASCNAKFSLGVISCESEATRKTPVTKVATGNYFCDGTATQNGNSQQYRVNSTCRPEIKDTQDKAIWTAHRNACIQAKMDDGRFKK